MQPSEYKPLTIGDWIITQIVLVIPLVGLVMLFVWAFSSDTHPSKKTYCQASLILVGVLLGLAVVAALILPIFGAMASHGAHPAN